MNKTWPILILAILTLALPGLAAIQSINYPLANDIISESARIRLDVTSAASTGCYFNYNHIKNVSISCNGISLVDLPSGSGTYNITVGDDAGSSITQSVTVRRSTSSLTTVIYALAIISMAFSIFLIIHLLAKLASFETSIYDVCFSFLTYFLILFSYQLSLEYLRLPFLISWLELFINITGWPLIIFSLINFMVCAIIRSTKKKRVKDERSTL